MNRARKWICMLLVMLLVFATIAGCANNNNNAQQQNQGGTEQPQQNGGTTEPAGTSTDTGTSTGNKTLRVAITTTPEAADAARGSNEYAESIYDSVYESLVKPNRTTGLPEPMLAESWEAAPDGTEYTFKLRQDAKFADGTPLTAKDVKYSMDRFLTIGEGFSHIFTGIVKETVVEDDYTVKFILEKPFGPFVTGLTQFFIVNSALLEANTVADGIYGENGDYGTGYALTNSVGSGPYVIKDFEINVSLALEKNPNYWQFEVDANAPDRIEMFIELEGANIKMLTSTNEVDLIHGRNEMVTLNAVLQNDGWQTVTFEEAGQNYFMFNTKKGPTDDVHIRKAIAYATDAATMRAISGDMPEAYGYTPAVLIGSATSGLETYDYNLDKAKEEIAQSKYANDLANYPITIASIQGNGETGKMCLMLGETLQGLGFTVEVREDAWVLYCNNEENIESSPHVTNCIVTANYMEAGSLLEFKYASRSTGNWNQNEWLQDEKFDTAINKALETVDDASRLAQYQELETYLVNEVCPSYSPYISGIKPAYNASVFSWPAGDGDMHIVAKKNYYYADFRMK